MIDTDDVPILLKVGNMFVDGLLCAMPVRMVEVKKTG